MQTYPTKKPRSLKNIKQNYYQKGNTTEEVEILKNLGLTGRQARVYLSLLKIGCGKAKAIADVSLVNRQEIYRILDDLQQTGLVQKNISSTATFTATPLSDIAKVLLTQKTAELAIIRQKTKQLARKLQNTSYKAPTDSFERPCLGTVFEGDKGQKYQQAICTTYQNIDIITSWKRFKQLTTLLEPQLQKTLQKKIIIRIATEKPPNQHLPTWITDVTCQNYCLKLKILFTPPTAAIAIFDQKVAAIAFDPNSSLTKGPDLWTANPTLLTLTQAYFDKLWIKTKVA